MKRQFMKQVHGIAFLKLIWPVDLSCDYSSPGSLPVLESPLGARLVPGLVLYVSMVWIVLRACRNSWTVQKVRPDYQVRQEKRTIKGADVNGPSRLCEVYILCSCRKEQILSFLCLIGIFLGASSYLPASNLLVIVGYLLSDRGLYGAAMGYSIVLSCALTYLHQRWHGNGDGFCKSKVQNIF